MYNFLEADQIFCKKSNMQYMITRNYSSNKCSVNYNISIKMSAVKRPVVLII